MPKPNTQDYYATRGHTEPVVLTRADLKRLNSGAIRAERNRYLEPSFFKEFLPKDPDMLYPVAFTMLHNDVEVRLAIGVARDHTGTDYTLVTIDVSIEDYVKLVKRGKDAAS